MPLRCPNFVENPTDLLWLGLLERNTKKPASEWLDIKDDALALNLELAIAARMSIFDSEVAKNQARRIAEEIRKMLFGDGETGKIDTSNLPEAP